MPYTITHVCPKCGDSDPSPKGSIFEIAKTAADVAEATKTINALSVMLTGVSIEDPNCSKCLDAEEAELRRKLGINERSPDGQAPAL